MILKTSIQKATDSSLVLNSVTTHLQVCSELRISSLLIQCFEGEENLSPPNMPFWHVDYLGLIIFKKQQMEEKLWKQSRGHYFVKEMNIIREVSICKGVF